MIKEGQRCLTEGKLNDAQNLFEEANNLEKWKDVYGTVVLANLAYICALKRNYSMAKHYMEDYNVQYGKSEQAGNNYYDPDEYQKLSYAQDEIDREEI